MLIPNWNAVLRRAWSIRLMLLAGLLSAAEIILPIYADDLPRGVFATLTIFAVGGAFVTRLLAQQGVTNATNE